MDKPTQLEESTQSEIRALQYKVILLRKLENINPQLLDLQRKVEFINQEIEKINKQDYSGVPEKLSDDSKAKRLGRPVGSGRDLNPISLRQMIVNLLSEKKEGMNLAEITVAVREKGYVSNTTRNFSDMVYRTLYNLISENSAERLSNGIYRLISQPS